MQQIMNLADQIDPQTSQRLMQIFDRIKATRFPQIANEIRNSKVYLHLFRSDGSIDNIDIGPIELFTCAINTDDLVHRIWAENRFY